MKKTLLLLTVLLVVSKSNCLADALLLTVSSTPYDRQMTPIHNVLTATSASSDNVSLGLVNEWMADLRDIPYGFQQAWKTPAQVESRQPADCKGKAVTLYKRMKAHGATNVRLVIGKRTPMSAKTHAWLEWQTDAGSYVLDPTFNYTATRVEKIGRSSYAPLYAFAGSKKFRASTTLIAQN
jgi:predicted transglutaminase-like cysteine proteinase